MKYFNFKLLFFFFALAMAIPPAWAETETVCTRTTFNNYVPVFLDAITNSNRKWNTTQMIYPAAEFTQMTAGSKIKSITFYVEDGSWYTIQASLSSKTIEVRMGEVSSTSVTTAGLQNRTLLAQTDEVYNGTPTISSDLKEMTFSFSGDGYTWNGGNLAIELYIETNYGDNQSTLPWKVAATQAGSSGYSTYNTRNSSYVTSANIAALPQMTISYESGSVTPTIGADESLTITDATTGTINVTGTGLTDAISASLTGGTYDWNLSSNLTTSGGTVDVSYTGRYLRAINTVTLSSTGADDVTVPVTYQPNMYIIGDYGNGWNFAEGTAMTNNNGTYTATITTTGETFLLFSKKLGSDVSWNSNNQYLYGPVSGGNWDVNNENLGVSTYLDLSAGVHNCIAIPASLAGTFSITLNGSEGTFTITRVLEQVVTPTFNPAEGTFTEAQSVTISCATDGATISYSTDGGTTWNDYNGAISVSETTTIMAKATKSGMSDSETATATYTINTSSGQSGEVTVGDASTYTYQLPAYYPSYYAQTNQMIYPGESLTEMVGNEITGIKFYTREGTTMNFSGTYSVALGVTSQESYSSATPITGLTAVVTSHEATTGVTEFEIEFDQHFKYDGGNLVVQFQVNNPAPNNFTNTYWAGTNMDYNVGYYSQYSGLVQILPKATFSYVSSIPTVATPTFSPAAGTYNSAQQVTISCETEGATISYSTDSGTTWTPYTSAITVSETTTIMAKAAKEGMTTSEASAEYIIDIPEDYAVTVSPDGGTIDFGTVDNEAGATKSKTITITNTGLQPVTPTLTALTAPFSTDYTPVQLASGESVTITITFTPTAEGTFTNGATLSFGNGIADCAFTLTGKGGKYDENDHSAIYDKDYTWIDANGNEHTSNLLEIATEPEHIIAMLREIYTNTDIPGNKVRGYTETGDPESLMINGNEAFAVNYSAVGQLNSSEQYVDQYGWNIPTSKPILSRTAGSSTYKYFDPTEYTPHDEGLTLIMVELKDGVDFSGNSSYYSFGSSALSLRDKVANTFKSARIITTYKKSGSGEEAGTLFKIDADKLNRFFFLAKGQLRIIDHGQAYESDWTNNKVHPFPSLKGSTFTDNSFNESAVLAPFEHMFEQFSPNQANSETSAMTDVYQELVNMESYEVVHDCVSIPYVAGNHEFNMYGVDSESDDCQDVRDMMFFVPDYRMKYWKASQYAFGDDTRDPNTVEKFVNYNKDHRPTLGLYVIRQNEITGDKQANADVYDLNLSWESNLLDFLPGAEAMYQLFRVVTDEFGNKTYELVATLDPNETTYVDHVPMAQHGQQVTYVVQGQDQTEFLSLQMSNEESYIIPGLDKNEIFQLSPKFDHYSRFDPLTEANYYANQLKVVNNTGTNIKGAYMGNGAKFTFLRGTVSGNDTTWVAVAEATSNGNGSLAINTDLPSQNRNGLYTHNSLDWIKMNNPSTVSYTVDGSDNVTFQNFNLYDNFCESVAQNNHPGFYLYKVEFEAPAGVTIQGTNGNTAHSNRIGVAIHKTDMDVLGYSKAEVDSDTDHSLDVTTRPVNEQVTYSSKTDILRYDLYRWNENDEDFGYILDFANSTFNPSTGAVSEQDEAPTGIAGNQAGEYTISMDGENQNENNVTIAQGETKLATFMDNVVQDVAGVYTYAPVVETFTTRGDYNTYGAPLQQTGVATIGAEVKDYIISVEARPGSNDNGVWTVGNNQYCHYTVTLRLSDLQIPMAESAPLKDYDLYKVRVWRQVAKDLVAEKQYDQGDKRNRAERIENVVTVNGEDFVEFLMEEKNNDEFDRTTVLNENTNVGGNVLGDSEITEFYTNWAPGTEEVMATFGAQKLRQTAEETGVIDELPMKFIIRAYYTRTANIDQTSSAGMHAPARGIDQAEDSKYYIAETTRNFTFSSQNLDGHTGLTSVVANREVTSVTYFNVMGQQSSKPFVGLNIVVTHYNDGTTSTAKVLK